MQTPPSVVRAVTQRIKQHHFPTADSIFLCGSVVRGEASATSDLDLVVLFAHVDHAWRESFVFESWPVECFCHDLETAEYYFTEMDRPSGIGALLHMVLDGTVVPNETQLSRQLRARAAAAHRDGPPAWGQAETDYSRYTISGLMDDLRGAEQRAERIAVATVLYALLAQHVFRRRGTWSAHGKTILRRLRPLDAALAHDYETAFANTFAHDEIDPLLALCERIIAPDGGYLFAGYRTAAAPALRKPVPHDDAAYNIGLATNFKRIS